MDNETIKCDIIERGSEILSTLFQNSLMLCSVVFYTDLGAIVMRFLSRLTDFGRQLGWVRPLNFSNSGHKFY